MTVVSLWLQRETDADLFIKFYRHKEKACSMRVALIQSHYSDSPDLIWSTAPDWPGRRLKICHLLQTNPRLPCPPERQPLRQGKNTFSLFIQISAVLAGAVRELLISARVPALQEMLRLETAQKGSCVPHGVISQDVVNLPHPTQRWHPETLACQRVGGTMTAPGSCPPGFIYFPDS